MIQYNVTIKLEPEVEEAWLTYMNGSHIKAVMDTGLFVHCRFSKLIQSGEESPSYTIQYVLPSMKHMHKYQSQYARALQADHSTRFKGKFVAFRTLMEIVSEHGNTS
jgi:hypothetical protein